MPLKKLMDAYCQRCHKQLSQNNVRFIFEGQRINQNKTPKDLNMIDGDQIDVMDEQIGGSLLIK